MYRVVITLMAILLMSCDPPVQEQERPHTDPYQEQFVKTNRYLLRRHRDHISAFVERVGWDARETDSGLWIVVEDSGKGPAIVDNDLAVNLYNPALESMLRLSKQQQQKDKLNKTYPDSLLDKKSHNQFR